MNAMLASFSMTLHCVLVTLKVAQQHGAYNDNICRCIKNVYMHLSVFKKIHAQLDRRASNECHLKWKFALKSGASKCMSRETRKEQAMYVQRKTEGRETKAHA
jgi:hypothetical protein